MKRFSLILILHLTALIVTAQERAIYTDVSGSGAPILFLPGFTAPGSVWDATIDELAPNTQRIKVSYAGFNGNPAVEMPWYPAIKKELLKYIKTQELTELTIIGHSMGGMLALDLAAALPDRVKKLLIVDALTCMRCVMMPGVSAEAIQYETPYNQQMLQQNDSIRIAQAQMMSQNMTLKSDKVALLIKP